MDGMVVCAAGFRTEFGYWEMRKKKKSMFLRRIVDRCALKKENGGLSMSTTMSRIGEDSLNCSTEASQSIG